MTPELTAIIVVGLGILTIAVWHLVRPLRDVGRDVWPRLIVEDYTEDQPIGTIDEALAQTTDPTERDALLDVRLRAMGGGR
jgi:hypothetical protein